MPGPLRGRGFLWYDSCKRPSPVNDHSVFAFWVVAEGSFDCREKVKAFLSPARQPEISPITIQYALTLHRFVLLSFFTLIEKICLKIWAKALPKNSRNPFPVDVHSSKTSLLKLACDRSSVFRSLRRLHAFPLCFIAYMIGCIKC